MSLPPLPPEIISLVISFTVGSPSPTHPSYRKRTITLRSISLVHRNWTRIVQEALRGELWTKEWETLRDRGGHRLAVGNLHGTEYFTVDGDLEHLSNGTAPRERGSSEMFWSCLESRRDSRWTGWWRQWRGIWQSWHESYSCTPYDLPSYVIPSPRALIRNTSWSFVHFSGLETFVLGQGSTLLMDTNDQSLSLPYLRRLVIYGETEIQNPESESSNLLSSQRAKSHISRSRRDRSRLSGLRTYLLSYLQSDFNSRHTRFRKGTWKTLFSQLSRQASQPSTSLHRLKPAHQASIAETQRLTPRFTASIVEAASRGRETSRIYHGHHRWED